MKKIVLVMTHTKSTKGTHVYGNDDTETPVPTLYVKRDALPATPPKSITVTIEEKE